MTLGVFLVCLLLGYLLGSLNTSIIFTKSRGMDIRNEGSGNAGATNTMRVMGKKIAAVVVICDILKAVVAIALSYAIARYQTLTGQALEFSAFLGGFGSILGHNFPVYFHFRGGKGIATSFGALLMLNWKIGVAAFIVFVIVVLLTRYVSLASCMAALSVPLFSIVFDGRAWFITIYALIGILAIARHRENLVRLAHGEEHKLGEKKA